MKRLAIAAVGLALVASAVIGGAVGSRFSTSAQPVVPNPGHEWSAIGLPEGVWPGLQAEYAEAAGYAAVTGAPPRLHTLFENEPFAPNEVKYTAFVDVSGCTYFRAYGKGTVSYPDLLMYHSPDGVERYGTPGAWRWLEMPADPQHAEFVLPCVSEPPGGVLDWETCGSPYAQLRVQEVEGTNQQLTVYLYCW